MKRWLCAVLGAAALAAPATAEVVAPLNLPKPPPVTNQTTSLIFDAMLAISRAQQQNPQAAQAASFAYTKAIERLRAGDLTAANSNALDAWSRALRYSVPAPLPVPSAPLVAPREPSIGLYGADAPAIDADAFLALTRGQLAQCAARKAPQLPQAHAHYAQALKDFAARNYQGTRLEARAAIDLCAQPQR
ncbi:MAG: hypothetical protein ABR591_01245 [Candidatus Velthaea sp.]